MKLIDFDKKFQEYIEIWFKENRNRFQEIEEMEARMPDLYMRWLNTSFDWADGFSPSEFFTRFTDSHILVQLMLAYLNSNVPVPDLLLDRIADMDDNVEDLLINIIKGEGLEEYDNLDIASAKMIAINLLNERQSKKPMGLYIQLISAKQEKDEIADNAAEALRNMGACVVEPVLKALDESDNIYMQESFIDILANYPGNEQIYQWILTMFKKVENKKALFASYLGKYGDDRAISVLENELKRQDLGYLDYIEIKNAIEELGGTVEIDRDFSGDQYYEALRNIE